MKQPYFKSLGMRVQTLPESECPYIHTHTPLLMYHCMIVHTHWSLICHSFSWCAVVLQTYLYLHWRKCSFRGTPVTGTPRTQRQVWVCLISALHTYSETLYY